MVTKVRVKEDIQEWKQEVNPNLLQNPNRKELKEKKNDYLIPFYFFEFFGGLDW